MITKVYWHNFTNIQALVVACYVTFASTVYQSLVHYMGAGHKTQNRMTRPKRGSQTSDGQPYFVQTWISKNKKIEYRRENIVHL